MSPHYLDLDAWPRRAHYDFFRDFELPFFGVTVALDVTALRAWARATDQSFFLASLYLLMRAANEEEPFRYRLRDDGDGNGVLIHDRLSAGATVMRDDETFGFCYLDYADDFASFAPAAAQRVQHEREHGKGLAAEDHRDDLIHLSLLPGLSFTSMVHARRLGGEDSTPKFVLGRYEQVGDRLTIPLSIEVHHALMDGLHVTRFADRVADYARDPAPALDP